MKRVILLIILGLIFLATAIKVFAYPLPKGYVNDYADVLDSQQESALEEKLSEFDKKTTDQISVVTIDSTSPESIEEYSIHLADTWKVGQKGKDNGVLMVFAMKDRKMRNEVGRGLEDDLTDIESREIQDNIIKPYFKDGDYATGIDKGVDAVIASIQDADESASPSATVVSDVKPEDIVAILVIMLIVAGVGGLLWLAFSEHTPFGGEGDNNLRGVWVPKEGSDWGTKSIGKIDKEIFIPIVPPLINSAFSKSYNDYTPIKTTPSGSLETTKHTDYSSDDSDDDDDDSSSNSSSSWGGFKVGGGSFGGFGGGSFSGGGSTSSW